MAAQEYDVVVIGAGPAGENVAARTVKGGLRTAVVESELVGGECSYWACIPSKALLRPLEVWNAARSIAGAREGMASKPNAAAILARRDSSEHVENIGWLAKAILSGLQRGGGAQHPRQ